jgi:hypothetical protein
MNKPEIITPKPPPIIVYGVVHHPEMMKFFKVILELDQA